MRHSHFASPEHRALGSSALSKEGRTAPAASTGRHKGGSFLSRTMVARDAAREAQRAEAAARSEERRQREEARERALKKRRGEAKAHHRRTRKGQPVMRHQMSAMLAKIEALN